MASFAMRAAIALIRLGGKPMRDPQKYLAARQNRTRSEPPPMPKKLAARCTVDERKVEGQRVLTLTPHEGRSRWTLIYLHGGAYTNEMRPAHWTWIAALMEATGARIILPLYARAPEHDHRPAHAMMAALYGQMLQNIDPATIVIGGDSSGAGLALGAMMTARDAGRPMPAQMLLFAPWLDITCANPLGAAIESRDPMLGLEAARTCGQWWAGDADPTLPHLSPAFGTALGLPPIHIYQGSLDMVAPDAVAFAETGRAAGANVTLHLYEGAPHVFVAAVFTREAKEVLAHIKGLLA